MPFTKIFFEEKYNATIHEQGYAIVPFLNVEEVKGLAEFFYANHAQLPDGMYASSHAPDFAFRKKMNEEIKRVCKRAVEVTFQNATPLGATFMVKSKGENGSLHPHQDWSIVDEDEFNSYNIWLPLVDVSEKNGTLLILPNSHSMLSNIRGLNIPSSFEKVEKEVWQYLVPVNMQAGEALVYDHRLLHASGLNETNKPRLVIVYGLIPNSATMRYYFGKDGMIEEYECYPEFYFSQQITDGPANLKIIASRVNENLNVEQELLKKIYGKSNSIFSRIAEYFK
ncbi:MAG: phytanoyl-CoA dioxygenase family protein [Chitinophagales bacterium]